MERTKRHKLIDSIAIAICGVICGANDLVAQGQVSALDGKCPRGSKDERLGKKGIDMVSAWATTNPLVLGQMQVDDKSNEITAIPALLAMLDVSGCIVTMDAIGVVHTVAWVT